VTAAIQAKPDYARLIGVITAEWSVVEMMLSAIFSGLLGASYERASAVFFALQSHRAKFDAVNAVGEVTLRDQPNRLTELKQLMRRIATVAKERNDFSHGLWGVSPTTGDVNLINLGNPRRGKDSISLDDLQAVADEIADIVGGLHQLYLRFAGFERLLNSSSDDGQ
jgi:hypothetical protein